MFYWRSANQEVDFIVEKNRRVVALDVKSEKRMSLTGVTAFRREFGDCRSLLIVTGGLPWEESLVTDINQLF